MTGMSALQYRVAQQILEHVIANRLSVGARITQQAMQELCGTSRTPVRMALEHLSELGVMQLEKHRGYSVVQTGPALEAALDTLSQADNESVYQAIAAERTAGKLSDVVSETELMRRFGLSRNRLRRVLDRIASEGWIERRAGNGWQFLPLINSARAYAESFEVRVALEPAGLMSAFFRPDLPILRQLLRRQQTILRGYQNASEVFEANAELHEQLARMSNNRFLAQIIVHHNDLRRLIEYHLSVDTARAQRMCREHIEFLELLIAGDRERATASLARHLSNARDAKLALLEREAGASLD